MKRLVLAVAVSSCGTKAAPPEPPHGSAQPPLTTPDGASAPSEMTRLELVEGTPTTLPDGTIVDVKNVMYAHMTESRNLSRCTLVVTHGGQTKEVGLERRHGEAMPAETPGEAFGWHFSVVMADPYQQPSRASVDAQKH